jgi:hypothetical protein
MVRIALAGRERQMPKAWLSRFFRATVLTPLKPLRETRPPRYLLPRHTMHAGHLAAHEARPPILTQDGPTVGAAQPTFSTPRALQLDGASWLPRAVPAASGGYLDKFSSLKRIEPSATTALLTPVCCNRVCQFTSNRSSGPVVGACGKISTEMVANFRRMGRRQGRRSAEQQSGSLFQDNCRRVH